MCLVSFKRPPLLRGGLRLLGDLGYGGVILSEKSQVFIAVPSSEHMIPTVVLENQWHHFFDLTPSTGNGNVQPLFAVEDMDGDD